MHRKNREERPRLHWWHHTTIVGALGVGALYVVDRLYAGMLLFYSGPGDPLWIDEIVVWWHVIAGALLGIGFVFLVRQFLRPSAVGAAEPGESRV